MPILVRVEFTPEEANVLIDCLLVSAPGSNWHPIREGVWFGPVPVIYGALAALLKAASDPVGVTLSGRGPEATPPATTPRYQGFARPDHRPDDCPDGVDCVSGHPRDQFGRRV